MRPACCGEVSPQGARRRAAAIASPRAWTIGPHPGVHPLSMRAATAVEWVALARESSGVV